MLCSLPPGCTGSCPANLGGISMSALLMSTARGLRSLAWASKPRRCASRGMDPPPAKGSSTAGSSPPLLLRISSRARRSSGSSLLFSHTTSSSMRACRRARSASCSSTVGNSSGREAGSSTSCANSTARAVASGLRDQYRCRVEGCPWRIDFSRADAALMASSGREVSMSFFFGVFATDFPSVSAGWLEWFGPVIVAVLPYSSSRAIPRCRSVWCLMVRGARRRR